MRLIVVSLFVMMLSGCASAIEWGANKYLEHDGSDLYKGVNQCVVKKECKK